MGIVKKYPGDKKSVVMTRGEVVAVDSWAINEIGIPGVVLMENAGRSCAEFIAEKLKNAAHPKVCIFCGTGNNGGDGFVIARHLSNRGIKSVVVICGEAEKIKGEARVNLDILRKLGEAVFSCEMSKGEITERVKEYSCDCSMIVDAIFGTGVSGELRGEWVQLIEAINCQNLPILAVDVPSGLDCDTGLPQPAAIRASWTITFVALKKGFTSIRASRYTGQILVASIGVEPAGRG